MRWFWKTYSLGLAVLIFGLAIFRAGATTYYVDVNSANPTPPYTNWSTAAADIQDAVNQASAGDTVLVTDGVYQAGGEAVNGYELTNRVAITVPITVESVNGPTNTFIEGYQMPGTNGDGVDAIRGVYMTNNAALIGFTVSGGATLTSVNDLHSQSGGGIWCEATTNDVISNCVVVANEAYYAAGGVYQGTLLCCNVSQNSLMPGTFGYGGGVYEATAIESVIADNSIVYAFYGYGGGAYESTLVNCLVESNSIAKTTTGQSSGGGAFSSSLTNCVVADNSVPTNGSDNMGGGIFVGTAVNCTIVGNAAALAGGSFDANLDNCINYFNTGFNSSASNFDGGTFSNCCTAPLPSGGNNITNDPQLVSVSQISLSSPCRGAGNAVYSTGTDINGNPWANPPSIGCEEPQPGSMTGSIGVSIAASAATIALGYPITFQADISGLAYSNVWSIGDGPTVTNEPYVTYSWPAVGSYPVVLTAYNDSNPGGISVTNIITVYQPTVIYVVATNQTPVAPYDSWAKAATNIETAVAAAYPGTLVLVSNGVYSAGSDGGTNRVAVTQPITLQSVNGPSVTTINGGSTLRCVYLANGAVLNGFTLLDGHSGTGAGVYALSTNAIITNCVVVDCVAGTSGGGAWSGTLDNCFLALNSGGDGGGALGSTLNSCVVSNNVTTGSTGYGGGAFGGVLNNCVVVRNSAYEGGGAFSEPGYPLALNNCLIVSNTASYGGGLYNVPASFEVPLYNCLTNCVATNCVFTFNLSPDFGSATVAAQLNNCLINSNGIQAQGGPAVEGGYLSGCQLIGNEYGAADDSDEFLDNSRFVILSNCMLVANSGAHGAVYGGNLYNCVLLQNAGTEGGAASLSGLVNCLIISNSAASEGAPPAGGGVYECILTNCILAYNLATNGGGAYQSTLVNCTLAENTAVSGGGVYDCTNENCILYYNNGGDYYPSTAQDPLNNCCTTVLPTNGVRNITYAPVFVNLAGGDYHLQSSSPCINSGENAYILGAATDLDGNPRIVGGTVDIGAYEFQTPTSVISYAYLQQYGLPMDGSVDFEDLDGTGWDVYQDWIAGLNPTNSASVLAMLTPAVTNHASGITVSWQSVNGIPYLLQRSTNLLAQPFSAIQNVTGQTGTTSYTDTSATNNLPYFYRVGVVK